MATQRNGHRLASVTSDPRRNASVTRSIVAPRVAPLHPTIAAAPEKMRPILIALHELATVDPDAAREAMRLARALLDRGSSDLDPELEEALSDLTKQTISNLEQDQDLTLASLSLTAPSGYGAVIEPLRHVAKRANQAASHGAILAVDYRPRDGVEHGYGIVIGSDVEALVSDWIDLVGSTTRASRATTVSGWRMWTRGEARGHEVLTDNTREVLRYLVKAHPVGSDLGGASVASGCFADAWDDFVARFGALRGEPTSRAVTRTCARCGVVIPQTKRPAREGEEDSCSNACRQALYRARNGAERTQRGVTRGEGR